MLGCIPKCLPSEWPPCISHDGTSGGNGASLTKSCNSKHAWQEQMTTTGKNCLFFFIFLLREKGETGGFLHIGHVFPPLANHSLMHDLQNW